MAEQFVSESIEPRAGTFDAAGMGRAEPGLPTGFRWRGDWFEIEAVLEGWKASSREGGRASGELYLRRHYYKLRMGDGSGWTVYFERQARPGGSAKRRWFLYTIDSG
jgi:hypothetical protein